MLLLLFYAIKPEIMQWFNYQPRIGRRLSLSGLMLVGGTALFLTVLVPHDDDDDQDSDGSGGYVWLVIALSMIGKLAITSSYGVIYIFSTEQFPTQVLSNYLKSLNKLLILL